MFTMLINKLVRLLCATGSHSSFGTFRPASEPAAEGRTLRGDGASGSFGNSGRAADPAAGRRRSARRVGGRHFVWQFAAGSNQRRPRPVKRAGLRVRFVLFPSRGPVPTRPT